MWDNKIRKLREYIIYNAHSLLEHLRIQKTYNYLNKFFYWPNSYLDCIEYGRQCDTCQRTKTSTQLPQGFAKLVPVWSKLFIHILMDFLSLLPCTPSLLTRYGENYFDSLWVIVCRYLGLKKLILVCKETNGLSLQNIFLTKVYPDWGMLNDIVSDRDTRFTSKEWITFCKENHINQSMSTAHHAKTDEQTKNANKQVLQVIRTQTLEYEQDWVDILPYAEAALNRCKDSARKTTPYETAYGFNPRLCGQRKSPPVLTKRFINFYENQQ